MTLRPSRARRLLCGLMVGIALLSACAGPLSPSPPKLYRIGWLAVSTQANAEQIDGVRAALRDLGYVEGRNYVFEIRAAEGRADRIPAVAAELVALKPDVIITRDARAVLALKQATTSIPILFEGTSTDPVADGLVASLARPGRNITGTIAAGPEIAARRLQLLKEAVPTASRVAYLLDTSTPAFMRQYQEARSAAPGLGIELLPFEVRAPEDVADALAAAARAHPDAVVVGNGASLLNQQPRILEFIAASHLPSITATGRAYVDGGALLYYNQDDVEIYRSAASSVDRILKGANPADLPIEAPSKFVFVINMRTAKALGLTIPPSVLAQATELIQ